jgi:hypothetical protein
MVTSESGYHLIRKIAEREVNKLHLFELGKVENVNIHRTELDGINYACSILLLARTGADGLPLKLENVPILTQYSGEILVPYMDDLVVVAYIYGEFELPVIIGKLYTQEKPAQVYEPGDYKLTFDPERYQLRSRNPINRRIIEFIGVNNGNEYRIEFRKGPVIKYTPTRIQLAAGESVVTLKYNGDIKIETSKSINIKTEAEAVVKCKKSKIEAKSEVKIKCENCTVDASGTIELGGNGAGIVTEQTHKCYFTGAPPLGSKTVKAKS